MLASKFNLAAQAKAKRRSGKPIALANVKPTKAQADTLAAIYLRVVAAWQAAQQRILAAYAAHLAELTTDAAGDTGSEIDSVAAEIQRLVLLLTPDLRQWAFRVEQVQRGKWVQSVLSATDVDLNTVLTAGDMNDTVQAAIDWNVALIKDVSSETQRRIANIVFSGFQQRTPARDIAKQISDAVGMARRRSLRIASDQTVKLGSRLNQARQEQAGITHFKWRHSAKAHPRLWHEARDGKVFSWRDSGIPADDMPGVPPFCFPSGQPISFHGDALVLWRRQHRGNLTELVAGERVAVRCTPNHPVLTDAGWKAAQDVQLGDYIFETRPHGLFIPNMDVEQAQPRIGDIFDSLELVFGSVSTNGLGGEFHRDATVHEQIDTIDLRDKSLRDHLKAPIPQSLADLALEIADVALVSGNPLGALSAFGETGDATTSGAVRGLDLFSSLLWRHFRPDELSGVSGASDFHAMLAKAAGQRWTTDLEPFRQRFQALASFVGADNFRFIELLAIMCRAIDGLRGEALPSAEMLGQAVPIPSQLSGGVAEQHPLLNGCYRKVEHVVTRTWAGHVFNLHNQENWYIAGTAVVHNCGCTAQGVISFEENE